MATTSAAKYMSNCTESEKESKEETSSVGMAKDNGNKEENNPSFELADNNEFKESIVD